MQFFIASKKVYMENSRRHKKENLYIGTCVQAALDFSLIKSLYPVPLRYAPI